MCVMLACPCSTGATRYVQKHAGTQAAPAAQQCHKMRHKQCASVSIPHRLATKVSSSAETLPVPAASVVATAVRATSAADSVPAMAAALPGLKPYLEAEAEAGGWVQVLQDTCRPSPMAMVYTRRTVCRCTHAGLCKDAHSLTHQPNHSKKVPRPTRLPLVSRYSRFTCAMR